jgi:23S rRNA (uracil1939-C5)-methyltransferase
MPDLQDLELVVERPVAGGRMLARHEGRIVFVSGAVPGERVRARVERRRQHVVWATVTAVLEASPDRREPPADPACGGMTYAHIDYARQLRLKGEVVVDAMRRIGRITLPDPVTVAPSPERGYRLRAGFHVGSGRAVFYREGSHRPCNPAATGLLSDVTMAAVDALVAALGSRLAECASLVVAENVAGSQRVTHLEPNDGARLVDLAGRFEMPSGVTGVTTSTRGRFATIGGSPTVTDTAADLFDGDSPVGTLPAWTRRASSFFQGNRFLTGSLVRRVLALAEGERCADLYAGVGLFAVALAARGAQVVAVEGDRSSGADLIANAGPFRERLRVVRAPVEAVAADRPDPPPDVVIVDPPRTGVSAEALQGILAWQTPRIVYVSCDPATLARDAARLGEAGYALRSIEAFDLFPNTPHIESVAAFDRATSASAPRSPSDPARA